LGNNHKKIKNTMAITELQLRKKKVCMEKLETGREEWRFMCGPCQDV
jgi:hypothetical protein